LEFLGFKPYFSEKISIIIFSEKIKKKIQKKKKNFAEIKWEKKSFFK